MDSLRKSYQNMEIKRSIELGNETIHYFEGKIKSQKWLSRKYKVNHYEDRIEAIKNLIAEVRKIRNIKWPEKKFVPASQSDAINLIQYYEDIAYNNGLDDARNIFNNLIS